MVNERQNPPTSADQLKDVSVFLRQADKLVKNGAYEQALAEIIKARTRNPRNLYAVAYEERVRSIMANARDENAESAPTPPKTPELEQISSRAIAEANRSAEAATRMQEKVDLLRKQETESRRTESQRRDAIRKKVEELISRSKEFHQHGEFNRALDEIARINMIDPSNEEVAAFEGLVRRDQEQVLRNEEQERQKRLEEEEQRRKDYLKSELLRIRREGEEKRKKEEENRRNAQQVKVNQHIKKARDLFGKGQLEEALSELAFVIVIDPLNSDMINLEQEIRDAEEKRYTEELERYRLQQAEQQRKREATMAKVRKQIDTAEVYLKQGKFSDALRVIAAAYVLDPLNDTLQQCEERIIKAQEDAVRAAEEERLKREEELRQKQEDEMRRIIQSAQERATAGESAEEENRKRADREKIAGYLKKARHYLSEERFENALGEIALAFVIDPFDDEIIGLEQEVWRLQDRKRSESAETLRDTADNELVPESEDTPAPDPMLVAEQEETPVAEDMHGPESVPADNELKAVAEQKTEVHETPEAVATDAPKDGQDEQDAGSINEVPVKRPVAQEIVRKPRTEAKPAVRKTIKPVQSIRTAEKTEQRASQNPPTQPAQKKTNTAAAQEPQRRESKAPQMRHTDEDDKNERITHHMTEAHRYRSRKEYEKATDEIAKAFMLDPLNEDVKRLERATQKEYASYRDQQKRQKAVRTQLNRAKMYLVQEDYRSAAEAVHDGLKIDPNNEELKSIQQNIEDADRRWKEAEELWEKVTANETQEARAGRFDSKQLYKEALANYYMKLETLDPAMRNEASGTSKAEPDMVDLEEEIRHVYAKWTTDREQQEIDEKQEAIRKHLEKAKQLLLKESFDEALAEVAFGRMVDDQYVELIRLEEKIWKAIRRKENAEEPHAVEMRDEDISLEERKLNVRVHLKAAEAFAEKKQFTQALDEIAKAYAVDPLNEEIPAYEERIRFKSEKHKHAAQGLTLVYTKKAANQ